MVQILRSKEPAKDLAKYELTYDCRSVHRFPPGSAAFLHDLPADSLSVDCSRSVSLRAFFNANLLPLPPHQCVSSSCDRLSPHLRFVWLPSDC